MTEHVAKAMAASAAAGGFWWCRHCRRVTELLDADHGERGSRCERCRSLKIEWKAFASEPEPARARQARHRLPAEKRDLRVLARTGYFFCQECEEVTKETEAGDCVLCGAALPTWHAAVLAEEAAP